MSNYPYDKSPAFFRIVSPELFFEAEAGEDQALAVLQSDALDSELSSVLSLAN